MEYPRTGPGEIQIVPAPVRISTAGMEESAPSVRLLGHDIGIRGGGLWGHAQVASIYFVLAAIVEDLLAERVTANQPCPIKREGSAGLGKIHQDIVRRAAGSLRLGADVAQLLRLRIDVDEFHLIDYPVAAG